MQTALLRLVQTQLFEVLSVATRSRGAASAASATMAQ